MLRVLIADGSDLIRERLRGLISEVAGTEVVGEASGVPETLEALSSLESDVLILDIRLPGGSGIALLKRLKEEGSDPAVIVLTPYAYPQYRKQCREAGAKHVFDKTTEFGRLVEVMERLARGEGGPGREDVGGGNRLPMKDQEKTKQQLIEELSPAIENALHTERETSRE